MIELPELNIIIDPIPNFSDFEEFIRLQGGSATNTKMSDDWFLSSFVKDSKGEKLNVNTLKFTQRMELLKIVKNPSDLFEVVKINEDEININKDIVSFEDPIGDYMYSLQEYSSKNGYQKAALKAVKDCYSLNGEPFKTVQNLNFYHGMVAYQDFLGRF